MTEKVRKLLSILQKREYRTRRTHYKVDITELTQGKNKYMQDALLMKTMVEAQQPWLVEGDLFGFNRSEAEFPFFRREDGTVRTLWHAQGNLVIHYEDTFARGMDDILDEVRRYRKTAEGETAEFYDAVILEVETALALADRWREYARLNGAEELYHALEQVPHKPAKSFYQACVFQKFLIFTLRCNGNDHMAFGRFDQYMKPYFDADREAGISEEALLELLEAYFISVNMDTDIYAGIQQGDNGQSMVLGGYDKDGNDMYNELSRLCMEASMELQLIDPKINLRVNRTTPIERYEFGTEMTKLGLGFPQYCNDDIIVPGLVALGYAEEDALDYAVAACWEPIIPGKGMDIVNYDILNFPKEVERAVQEDLAGCESFEKFLDCVKEKIRLACEDVIQRCNNKRHPISPYMSVFVKDCIRRGKDIRQGGAVYNNYGIHGVGIATAAESVMAVKRAVFEEKICSKEELLTALRENFEGHEQLRNDLLSCPKMGNNDNSVDLLAGELMAAFSQNLQGKPNNKGGVYRAGTGTANNYVEAAATVGATPDGRKAGDHFGTNFSPALTTKVDGPLSCIQSFTKFDLKKIVNGGPLTMEIHDTVFHHEGGVQKVAALVRAFIQLGGHQLQLNSVNRERLLDAREHPEDYQNLIVRVWGWSGYFVELDPEYQEHVIKRTEYTV